MKSSATSFSTITSSVNARTIMESDSIVIRVAFLFAVIIAFILALKAGVALLSWGLTPGDSPHFIDGMVDATLPRTYSQNPSDPGAIPVHRSNNERDGIEFTWSVWIFINSLHNNPTKYKNIFYKGNRDISNSGLNSPINSPGLYIAPNVNSLVVMMSTFNSTDEEITIPNIPLNKWVNVVIRCRNTTLDVYINGTISRSLELGSVPFQNNGNVYVADNGGFDGHISNLWYYDYALTTIDIAGLVQQGPDTNLIGATNNLLYDQHGSNYLSLKWFMNGLNGGSTST